MRSLRLSILAGCGVLYGAEALAPALEPGFSSGKVKTAISTVVRTVAPTWGFAPLPTTGPILREGDVDLKKRQNEPYFGDICGYVSGDAQSPFGCGASSKCRTDTSISVIHCCPATLAAGASCVAITTCLNRSAFSALTTTRATSTNPIPLETGWCTSSLYPECVQYVYGSAPISGFTWMECGGQATRQVAQVKATTGFSLTSSSRSSSSTSTSPGGTTTTTVPPTPDPTPASSNSTPTGAIVGGVVGGLAVIGLVVLGLFYIARRRRAPSPSPGPQQPDVAYAPVPPPPGPESPPIGYTSGPLPEYRGSMFKAPYDTTQPATSPTASPGAPYHSTPPPNDGIGPYQTPSPGEGVNYQTTPSPSEGMMQYNMMAPQQGQGMMPAPAGYPGQPQYQQPGMGQYQQPGIGHPGQPGMVPPGMQPQGQQPVYPEHRYELPIERGDGEIRELPGR